MAALNPDCAQSGWIISGKPGPINPQKPRYQGSEEEQTPTKQGRNLKFVHAGSTYVHAPLAIRASIRN